MLVTQSDRYQEFSGCSGSILCNFTLDKAALNFVNACRHALVRRKTNQDSISKSSRPRVVITERQLLQYRVAFYERLRVLLDREGVDLQLLIGEGTSQEVKKKNQVTLPWSISIPTRYFFSEKLCWQPFGAYARDADLVIVMHENKLIYNLWLLSFGRPRRLAFWGHGRNMQSDRPHGLKERFKRWTVTKVDWWFAYTESSAALIQGTGFPRTSTTVVENAVDTNEMAQFCKEVSEADLLSLRKKLALDNGPIGLYLGSLYHEKRLGFLLDAATRIREKIPSFQLLVVGAGPEQPLIEAAAQHNPWMHYLGPLQGRDKARALMLADVMLNPGLVGLGVLDSFVSGRPMFTTDCGLHSPEISYLSSGQNGIMTANNVDVYATAVASVLSNQAAIAKLQAGARATASRYTVENMADRICTGILSCLARH